MLWLPKSHEPYAPGPDADYYLGLNKSDVLAARTDVLGEPRCFTEERVSARRAPPRNSMSRAP